MRTSPIVLVSRLAVLCLLLPLAAYGQKKNDILELQRDLANVQDDIRTLKKTQDDRFTALQQMMQSILDGQAKTTASVSEIQKTVNDQIASQVKSLNGPVAGLATRMETLGDNFTQLKEQVNELSRRMDKVQTQLTDIQTAISIIQNPPAPGPAAGTSASTAGTNPPPAGVTSDELYSNARKDQIAGNTDLAFESYSNYLKWFPAASLASNSQYYIGEIYYNKGDFDKAIEAFDAVLTKYPDSNKLGDAQYMKGQTYVKLGRKSDAADEFKEVVSKFKNQEIATKAADQLRRLGNVPPAKRRK